MKRLIGIAAVWTGCALAWVVLGSTLLVRSDDSSLSGSSDVQQLWGPAGEQSQPRGTYRTVRTVDETQTVTNRDGSTQQVVTQREEETWLPVPLVATDIHVDLALEHRRRGLQWYPTYTVDLDGRYTFRNPTDEPRFVRVAFPLSTGAGEPDWSSRSGYAGGPSNQVYDGFAVRDDQEHSVDFEIEAEQAHWTVELAPGESRTFVVRYQSRGTESWRYRMAAGTSRVTDFRLEITTDFEDVDFPDDTLSPTRHQATPSGWNGVWDFESLIANRPIGVDLPNRLNPGPLAARITFFAPVGLLFFFFVVGILAMAKKKDLHPMHYFFLGTSFFAFHLLFAYLVDHLEIGASFAISAAVSLTLVVTYARLFTGWRFALQHVGISQVLYLVLFSCTFMWEGFTGLAITIGAILTLFVMMQITGRATWGKKGEATPKTSAPLPEEPTLDARPRPF